MMLRLQKRNVMKTLFAAALVAVLPTVAAIAGPTEDSKRYAMVPLTVIYPGQAIASGQVRRVEVTNPNFSGDYATDFSQVEGMITKSTLIPDRAISLSSLREPFAVTHGQQVRLIYNNGSLQITALGMPLQDGSIGELIRVRNTDSGLTVSGTILGPGIVQVVTK
ncbi:flagellar basal body P-ring formation chaperone FlgA [Rhizobium sp. C1]|uniref:flagellar basal body P-ring formation chaperone FlgA n=1 Tax=Rhizobium sp. C1 TaxID=1349799 RepID=UPI001E2F59D4|nr:flagellar basal body P-ring formation chaperone FlgA [Rhizobium sp. C1]MCD2179018.1 flagellar basal body P-ring formation protein FlgA [Rhizobium sp. C1]